MPVDTSTPAAAPRLLPRGEHHPVPEVATSAVDWAALADRALDLHPSTAVDERLVDVTSTAQGQLPPDVRRALADFTVDPGPAGALLVHGLPVGDLPATPASPTAPSAKDRISELILLTVARALGEPVGYGPEHGGALVQNLLPVRAAAATQTSTSSAVDLEFHTETAFHPHRPRYLLLSCLRSDRSARTYLCSVRALLEGLTAAERLVLSEPRFRTRVDESFGGTPDMPLGPLVPVLSGDRAAPTLVFDDQLMVGTDPKARRVLARLADVARTRRLAVVLEPCDLLVVDNHACIHGRSSFSARFDGTDRWLQRAFVIEDLAPSASDRAGRIINTDFANVPAS